MMREVSSFSLDLLRLFPNQMPPPTPFRYLLLAIRTPNPIPMAVPTKKAVMPTHTIGLMMGLGIPMAGAAGTKS